MRRTIGLGVLAVLLAIPAVAAARPSRWDSEERPVIIERMNGPDTFDCSAGGEGALPVAAAALGLMLWRRRER